MKKIIITLIFLLTACQPKVQPEIVGNKINILTAESFLADITQNVAGNRTKINMLIPLGLDPHAFQPSPQDVIKISECDLFIINGAGLEEWLDNVMPNVNGNCKIIEASAYLRTRESHEEEESTDEHHHEGRDPHYWLDPLNVIKYVENIRDGLILLDPEGKEVYTKNTSAYITELNELNEWIKQQISVIPDERRLIVTNHESFGYFADRYGFRIIGTIIPSVSTGAEPSAQQMAELVDRIQNTGATVIFLETGSNPQLAEQISQETGVKVVSELYTHSLTEPNGNAPTYIEMMKFNVKAIVDTLNNGR